METQKTNPSAFIGMIACLAALLTPCWLPAQESGLSKKIVSGDQMNSLYIIGSVLVFGIIAYFVYSIIEKNRRPKTEGKPQSRRQASHRHHHSHRVIKKSA